MKSERCKFKNLIKNFVGACITPTLLIIVITFTTGFYYDRNINIKMNDITVELGEKLPEEVTKNIELITDRNNLAIESNVPLDEEGHTTKIGTFQYFVVYNDNLYKQSTITNTKSMVTVIDTIRPTIIIKDNLKFKYGSKIKPEDIASCYDLSKCKLTISNINTNKSGNFEVNITATDEGNNETYTKTTITILEKPKPVYSYSKKYEGNYKNVNEHNNSLNDKLTEEEKNNLRQQIVNYAKKFIGNPYVYGGTSLTNGTDCSGFTMGVYGNFGYRLTRSATSQGNLGKSVSSSELKLGDIIVYYYENGGGHVGIYAGNGMMVHAGTTKTGIEIAPIFKGYKTYQRIIY